MKNKNQNQNSYEVSRVGVNQFCTTTDFIQQMLAVVEQNREKEVRT